MKATAVAHPRGPQPVAVGHLGSDGPWIGFVRNVDGFRLAFGPADSDPAANPWVSTLEGVHRRAELLSAAIAYYGELLGSPPAHLEATQADLAQLISWLRSVEDDPRRRRQLNEAMDAIDDGLAGDVVVARLSALVAATETGARIDEQADPLDLLVSRYEALSGSTA